MPTATDDLIRLALSCIGLVLVALRFGPRAQKSRRERLRLIALGVTAVLSFGAYYGFFQARHHGGFKDTDVYHYYMGSKYFAELGYYDLYDCSVRVLADAGELSRFDLPPVRDMRTMRMQSSDQTLARSFRCPERFSPDRWAAFEHDVLWFSQVFPDGRWRVVFRDHGFHPTPVWAWIGGRVATWVPLGSGAFEALLLADRALMLLAMVCIAWAFGFEAAAIALIVWGTGHHWGYAWIGDAFLRTLWLATSLVGLCLLFKSRFVAAGALLSVSSLLRIFPAIFIVGVGLGALRSTIESRSVDPGTRRFFVGVLATGAVLVLASVLFGGRGLEAYAELAEKMAAFSDHPSSNKLGLSALIWHAIMSAAGQLTVNDAGQLALTAPASASMKLAMRGIQLAVIVPAAVLYWRALRRVDAFEATVLMAAWIPLLSSPTNYYYGFVLVAVMVLDRRPWIARALLSLAVAWNALGILLPGDPREYVWASGLALVFAFAWLASAGSGDRLPARAGG